MFLSSGGRTAAGRLGDPTIDVDFDVGSLPGPGTQTARPAVNDAQAFAPPPAVAPAPAVPQSPTPSPDMNPDEDAIVDMNAKKPQVESPNREAVSSAFTPTFAPPSVMPPASAGVGAGAFGVPGGAGSGPGTKGDPFGLERDYILGGTGRTPASLASDIDSSRKSLFNFFGGLGNALNNTYTKWVKRGLTYQGSLEFKVSTDAGGRIKDLQIVTKTGNREFEDDIKRAVLQASPVQGMKTGLTDEKLKLDLRIVER